MKLQRRTRGFYIIILGICCAIFITCAFFAVLNFSHSTSFKNEIEELNSNAVYADGTVSDNELELHDISRLAAINEDCKGWLSIPETKLSYPVMQRKASPEFYLNRNFQGEKSKHGLPFLAEDVELRNDHDSILIYAHYMKDGSLFGSLLHYEQASYGREHPYVVFESLGSKAMPDTKYYRVFAVFKTTADEAGFDYNNYVHLDSQESYNDFIDRILELALYKIGDRPSYGERLLLLSTCEYSKKNGRFVLVAVQK